MAAASVLVAACQVSENTVVRPASVELSTNPLSIKLEPPLKVARRFQLLCADVSAPYAPDWPSFAIKAPDGSMITPVAELVTANGHVTLLSQRSYLNTSICFSAKTPDEPGVTYSRLRLSADHPVTLHNVHWVTTDQL
jgi:hypothetical protein